jgi:3-hydroxyisobutyrate dehydrogenase-like beta-hydroxyacid dehydrogenase
MTTVGFVGLGAMGTAMVERLLDAGHTVIGHNRTKSKAEGLLAAGMQWAGSPRAVAEAVDITLSMIANDKALQAITTGPAGILAGLGPGKVHVSISTVSPTIVRELAAQTAEKGAQMLDVPVSGSPVTIRQGKLTFMAGGDEAAIEQVKPILLDIGQRVTYIGPSGSASVLKIAVNINVPVQLLGLFEAVILAEKNGIPRELALEVMLNSAIASPAMQYRGPFALKLPEEPLFDVTAMLKDLKLALELGRDADVSLPTTAVTEQIILAAKAMGFAAEDFAVAFKVLARLSGLDE